jgi:hypothetical protein
MVADKHVELALWLLAIAAGWYMCEQDRRGGIEIGEPKGRSEPK